MVEFLKGEKTFSPQYGPERLAARGAESFFSRDGSVFWVIYDDGSALAMKASKKKVARKPAGWKALPAIKFGAIVLSSDGSVTLVGDLQDTYSEAAKLAREGRDFAREHDEAGDTFDTEVRPMNEAEANRYERWSP